MWRQPQQVTTVESRRMVQTAATESSRSKPWPQQQQGSDEPRARQATAGSSHVERATAVPGSHQRCPAATGSSFPATRRGCSDLRFNPCVFLRYLEPLLD
ncbi:hypothetical protein Acr_00g0063950 [Actinidia rufa]|uniref:Uncharacterized protein n=1 Tax=Actinidia rufa TaxID=165716 RepID=A0A7J0DR89_9ERIC|nr:hypothetical protein Acr_00g0063950 [Actinidia rufa]